MAVTSMFLYIHSIEYSTYRSVYSYLIELRNIAINRRLISSGTSTRLKRSPILLGSRRVKQVKKDSKSTSLDLDDEDNWDLEYDLLRPNQIVVADDTNAYQHFGDVIFAAPQEDILEGTYRQMLSMLPLTQLM